MSKKVALLIGVSEYGEGLDSLRCPGNGVEAMRAILEDTAIGGFEVETLLNPDVGEMRDHISRTFAALSKDDLALLYFTGHGLKDIRGDFYLSTAKTHLFENGYLNTGTAVEADFIKRELRSCWAERKVVVLDCCFGAAFADGFLTMDDSSVDVEAQLGDKGWCVMTAATSRRYALEQLGEDLSVYTRYLVEGLKTGGAALDGREFVSVQHWHDYVRKQVKAAAPAMEPALFNGIAGENIWIAKAQVDNEQSFRKQMQGKIRNGEISFAARMELVEYWQQQLGITTEQAEAIEEELLKPYREKAKHLGFYVNALEAQKAKSYPFDEGIVQDFRSLQRTFGLDDRSVRRAEKRVLGEQISDQMVSQSEVPQSEVPQAVMLEPEAAKVSAQCLTFSFDTVRVNEQGEIAERLSGTAEYFTEDLGGGIGLDMVRILGGKFLMGAAEKEEGGKDYEYPQHEVTVPDFWVGKFVVTQAQWKAVASLSKIEKDLDLAPANFKGEKLPVEQVSWSDAMEFCKRLSRHSDRGYTLPSEAQWEYACRAGTTTPFCFGTTITSNLANFDGTKRLYGDAPKGEYRRKTTDVGSFPPNAFGLYDTHGNVLEWCADKVHSSYRGAPVDGSVWPASGPINRVYRGGAWGFYSRNCRSAYRGDLAPNARNNYFGFRVSCSASKV